MHDLTGRKFGRLEVIERNGSDKHKHIVWMCKCKCGNFVNVPSNRLLNENTMSCGCLKKEIELNGNNNKIHGESKTKLFKVWVGMKQRCFNENIKGYENYGGRGITVCEEWINSYENFRNWAIQNGYKDGMTIERKDVNGNYCPENCTWITKAEQSINRRNVYHITYKGIEHTVIEWSDVLSISPSRLYYWINKHKDRRFEEAIDYYYKKQLKKGVVINLT